MLAGAMRRDLIKAVAPLSPACMIPEGARQGRLLGYTFDPENIPDEIVFPDGKKLNGYYIRRQIGKGGIGSLLSALNPHTAIYTDLIDSINNDRQPVADAYAGYTSVDNLMGIYKAAKTGETIRLPLTEDFSSIDMTGYFKETDNEE